MSRQQKSNNDPLPNLPPSRGGRGEGEEYRNNSDQPAKAGTPNKVTDELYSRAHSFRYAFAGWWYVLRTQHNAWIHALVSTAVFLLGLWLQITRQEWAILILTMMAVWVAEFMNTALEAVVDMTMPDPHPLAKVAKDVAAAAVLLGAISAVLIGLLILGPPIWVKLFG